ncbi:MAG: response regulator [Candidatus Desantisbacteria bacterium]
MSSSEDSLRALIVDDSGATRLRIKSILEKCGFEIIWISMTGIESIAKAKALKPQLIVINVQDMLGIEVIKKILSYDNTIKMLIIGRPGQESYIGESILIGAIDYFLEPFKDEAVAEMVWKIFQ